MSDFDIEEELKKLPDKPGVYIMHDKSDGIIYVGKAIILKNRVRSYFRESTKKSPKITEMVKRIDHFEYIVTDSELEALVLECNLIKEHRPKYNTLLKDDKTYPYIKVTVSESYPRIQFSRLMKKDRSRYFGPYTSASSVKDTIELINKIYKLRTCNRRLPEDVGKDRACLNHHIGKCMGPCNNYCKKEEYAEAVKGALEFLNGNYSHVFKYLEDKMNAASEAMEYEEAIEYRDLYNSVKSIAQKQKITSFNGEDRDVIAMYQEGGDAVVQVFFIRDGRMIGREHFFLKNVDKESPSETLSAFLKQFYSGTPFIPRELMLQYEVDDKEVLEEWLSSRRGSKVIIHNPKKGMKERLVELAEKNAITVMQNDRERIKRAEGRTIGAVAEIAELIGLEHISRMEAFDISNISGFESVGSMVVYENGRPKKSDYRKFKIKTVIGPNDYASMKEVLTRRFTHGINERNTTEADMQEFGSFTKFPDVIMMDGGKGQVNIALEVLDELGLNIPVCGMVKDDHHRTRGLYYNDVEIPIDTHSEGFKLITRIQDEAHRFAIEFHRSLRSKEQVKSVLDGIDHIGPARRKALLRYFSSVENIMKAEVHELMEAESMNEEAARSVYEFFHSCPQQ